MSGGSKSRTQSSNTTKDFTTNNVDNRVGEGDIGGNINLTISDITATAGDTLAGAGGGGGVNTTITTSDFGALDTASDLADRAFQFSENAASAFSESSKSSIEKAIESSASTVGRALGIAEGATQDESARTQQLVIIAVAGVGLAFVLRGVFAKAVK
jgi:hypothetical protein